MYEEHPVFEPPPDRDTSLWRYMDFTKFAWMLDQRALFFSRADLLGDRFEGAYSAANIALRPVVYGEHAEQMSARFEPIHRALPRYTVVNCWHMNESESAAMWRLYLKSGEGVAIRSTFRRLTESFSEFESAVYIGVVKYADYEREWIPERNSLSTFVHKRRSFEHEREVRAIRQDLSPDDSGRIDLTRERFAAGEAVPVRLDTLIERVYVAPGAATWLRDLVASVALRFGLDAEIVQSRLDADPVY